jgi:uncharacterized UPF0160 family protein
LDAHDNGISAYPSNLTPLFKQTPTHLPARVAQKNPAWNETFSDTETDASCHKELSRNQFSTHIIPFFVVA